jgi:phosphatidylserine/phosphatidylglycerophosphate/cardiolipin synthase-like enzyme
MSVQFTAVVERLISKAPATWLFAVCETLRGLPTHATADIVLQGLPATANADLSYLAAAAVRLADGQMSWEALSWTLQTTSAIYHHWQAEHHIELLWAGPSPANHLPARRIDQALYDLIAVAKREILLVTFAAAKIERLTRELMKAARRGVQIRLILEFEESSEGQLSYDAMKAFPEALLAAAEVFYWPVEKRERNLAGRPGKLHAKVAIVDECALVSSANLTDDAFNRNLEVGLMVRSTELLSSVKTYLESLIANKTLQLLSSDGKDD